MHDNGVIHSACGTKSFIDTYNVGVLLSDGYINTNNILTFLVQNGINSDSCFTGTAVTDNKFTLSTANRHHGVDTFQPGLQGDINRLSVGNSRCFNFNVAIRIGFNFAFPVNSLS